MLQRSGRRGPVRLLGAALAVGALLVAVGCSKDDGGAVRATDDTSGSGSASGSGSGSGSGISVDSVAGTTDNPLVLQAAADYKTDVLEQIDSSIAGTAALTAAIQAGDLEAAQAAYPPSRVGWERIEPVAELVSDVDAKVDSRVDDFASESDPDFTGWHRIEYLLWEQSDTASALPFAQQLESDLAGLKTQMEGIAIPPEAMAVGASELIDEVSQGKISGEEDRYSHTDMWDLAANVDGSQKAIELLTPALQEADPALLQSIDSSFEEVDAVIAVYKTAHGYQLFTAVTPADLDKLKTTTAQLSEQLSQVAGALGLEG